MALSWQVRDGGRQFARNGKYLVSVRPYGEGYEGEVRQASSLVRVAAAVYPTKAAARIWCETYSSTLYVSVKPSAADLETQGGL